MLVFIIFYLLRIVSSYRYLPQNNASPIYSVTNRGKLNKYTASISDVPYQILIVYGSYYCSGTLIRSKIAITAASCFIKAGVEMPIVKIGANSINGPGQVITVREVLKHEYYRHLNDFDNDIAMIILHDDVIFGENVKKAILVDPEVAIRVDTTIHVHGWGGSDRRLSDNGGPATYGDLLVGILSYGAAYNQEPFVAILTNVSYFHRWIQINSERFLRKYCQFNDDDTFKGTNEYEILSQAQKRYI